VSEPTKMLRCRDCNYFRTPKCTYANFSDVKEPTDQACSEFYALADRVGHKGKRDQEEKIKTVPVPGGKHSTLFFEQIAKRKADSRDVEYEFVIWEKAFTPRFEKEIIDDIGNIRYIPLNPTALTVPPPPIPYECEEKLWDEIRQFIWDHWDFYDERAYDVLTGAVKATWTPEFWDFIGYLFFFGREDTGKSRAIETLKALVYRGYHIVYPSPGTLYWLIESWLPILLFDEIETFSEEGKQAVVSIINAGQRRGASVPRLLGMDTSSPRIRNFLVYGSGLKALAGTQEAKKTLRSRGIVFICHRATRKVKKLQSNESQERARILLGKLLQYRIDKTIDRLDKVDRSAAPPGGEEVEKLLDKFSDRVYEVFYAILSVAPDSVKPSILGFIEDLEKDKLNEEKGELDNKVFEAIQEAYKDGEVDSAGRIATSTIAEIINRSLPEKEQLKVTSVAWIAKRLGFKKVRMSDGGNGIRYDSRRVNLLLKDPRYSELGSVSLLDTSTPPGETEKLSSLSTLSTEDRKTQYPDFFTSSKEVLKAVKPSESPPMVCWICEQSIQLREGYTFFKGKPAHNRCCSQGGF